MMTTLDQSHDDHRKNLRVEFDTRITLRIDDKEFNFKGHSRDISLKGIFVDTDLDIPVGTPCLVEIHLNGMDDQVVLQIASKIIRKEENGLAILFSSMDLTSFTHLRNIVRYNTSSPDHFD